MAAESEAESSSQPLGTTAGDKNKTMRKDQHTNMRRISGKNKKLIRIRRIRKSEESDEWEKTKRGDWRGRIIHKRYVGPNLPS